MEKKLNNMLAFSDFEKNWKPEESKKTKRTEVGLDIVKEGVDSVTKTAKLIPYTYHHSLFSSKIGGEPELVYVDADHKHPDPSKIMLWGWNEKGETISDFKRYFERKGKSIEIPYKVPSRGITANSEKTLKILAIKKWIETKGMDSISEKKEIKKTYNIQHNIGKVKYVVNFHDGVKTHKDGSPFFDMKIFKNKEKMNDFIKELKKKGYSEK